MFLLMIATFWLMIFTFFTFLALLSPAEPSSDNGPADARRNCPLSHHRRPGAGVCGDGGQESFCPAAPRRRRRRASERACTAPKRARARGLKWRQKKVLLTDNIAVWLGCGSPGILQTCFSLFLLMSPFTTLVAF